MRNIGIIGGLGPMASVYYLECITRMTDAKSDQEHPRVYLESLPDIPDRTDYILGLSDKNPLEKMIEAGKSLEKVGADFITIPCVTAHYFWEELKEELNIPLVSLVDNVTAEIMQKGIKKVGVLATSGTLKSKIFDNILNENGVEVVKPDNEHQKMVMEIIYDQIKKDQSINWDSVEKIFRHLESRGAEKMILGCTELPLLKKEAWRQRNEYINIMLYAKCVDVIEVLAKYAVLESGAKLKKKYEKLF